MWKKQQSKTAYFVKKEKSNVSYFTLLKLNTVVLRKKGRRMLLPILVILTASSFRLLRKGQQACSDDRTERDMQHTVHLKYSENP